MLGKFLLVGLCIIASVHKISARTQPINQSNENKGNGSNNYDEYEDYDDELNTLSNEQNPNANAINKDGPTVLVTPNSTKRVKPGDNVSIECEIQNRQANTVVLWSRGSSLIKSAKVVLLQDPRMSWTDNNTLEIKDVQVEDDNVYTCQVEPSVGKSLTTIKVFSAPRKIKILNGAADVSEQTIDINKNIDKKIQLDCQSEGGYPEPSIKWSSNGDQLHENSDKKDITINKGSLYIANIKRHHSGIYQCLADNGIDKPIHTFVNLNIKYHPVFIKHHDFVNTGEGYSAEINCLYDSHPAATKILWTKGDEKYQIRESEKYTITHDNHHNHNRTRLTINNVNKDDLVTYYCKIHNELGENMAKTILGLVPAPAHMIKNFTVEGGLMTVWAVRSIQPLTELQILYKTKNTGWREVKAEITENNKMEENLWHIKGKVNIPDGEWEVSARAKNTEGWAHTDSSSIHTIKIPGEQRKAGDTSSANTITIGLTTLNLVSLLVLRRLF